MNRSPLHDIHESLGARFVDFGGREVPLQYESVLAEHRAVRTRAGFFDVTHLGRFELTGAGARRAIRRLLCNDIDRIEPGRTQYTMMLNPEGGIVDDMIVWWWDTEGFWVLPNAANQARVMAAFAAESQCEVADLQTTTVMIALQGPEAPSVFETVLGETPRRFRTTSIEWNSRKVSIAGTGYTGEAGGEICADADTGRKIVSALVEAGVTPCGVGARDTLRLESGLVLWGNDIDETTTPLEAGLGFAVAPGHTFVGRDALVEQRKRGLARKLTGFVLVDRGIPRRGHEIKTETGGAGQVTSGNLSPMLETGVGLGYISPPPDDGGKIEVRIRDRWVPGRIAKPPFHETRN